MTEIQLNDRWRAIQSDYDPPQWMLQRLDSGKWLPKSWCQTRKALLTAINEKIVRAHDFYQGGHSMPVDPSALDAVASLPEKALRRIGTSPATQDPSGSEIDGEKRYHE
jgi:hypothetical protein